MLLINRLRNSLARTRPTPGSEIDMFLAILAATPVVVASEEVRDIGLDGQNKLPWRPPYESTWVEMDYVTRDSETNEYVHPPGQIRWGGLTVPMPPERLEQAGQMFPVLHNQTPDYGYYVTGFAYHPGRVTLNQIPNVGVLLHPHGEPPERFVYTTGPLDMTRARLDRMFPAQFTSVDESDPNDIRFYRELSWALVSMVGQVFTALHCRNVIRSQYRPTEVEVKRQRKGGKLPPVVYSTLAIQLPGSASGSPSTGGGLSSPKRLHTVRGHFKNLKDPRFKEPGWHWWPAHLRGSADKGVVVKDYNLTARPDGEARPA